MIYIFNILVLIAVAYILLYVFVIVGFIIQRSKSDTLINITEKQISVIIPVRNESGDIINCLQSLLEQNYVLTDYEVIVVNDHSEDDTYSKVEEFILSNDCRNFKLVNLVDGESKKKALELGVTNAKYSNIATTDADCVLSDNWLLTIRSSLDSGMLIGPVIQEEEKGFLANFQILDMLALQGVGFGTLGFNSPTLNNAANLAYTKEAFNSVNGYDKRNTPSGDDVFLLEKFKCNHQSIKGILRKDFIVTTKLEATYIDLINQRLRWASKSKFYKNRLTIVLGLITILQNLSMLFIYLGLILVENYRLELLFLLICKWLIDFILLFLVASFFKRRRALAYFIPIQIVYPFYIVLIWVLSLTMSYNWRGRKING